MPPIFRYSHPPWRVVLVLISYITPPMGRSPYDLILPNFKVVPISFSRNTFKDVMEPIATEQRKPGNEQRYRWPWVVLAFLVLGIVLAVLWMSRETRRIHDLNT